MSVLRYEVKIKGVVKACFVELHHAQLFFDGLRDVAGAWEVGHEPADVTIVDTVPPLAPAPPDKCLHCDGVGHHHAGCPSKR
jgi:hypothetical protein